MTCYHSKPAWKSELPNEKGQHTIRFKNRKREPDYYIGCGKCPGCHAEKSREWGIRMYHESKLHDRNCFATLTYDEEHYPKDGKINKPEIQKFIKRIRNNSDMPIRYFITGEYGEKTHRAHYHAILFGEDFLGGSYNISRQLYGNKYLDDIWQNGHVTLAEFNISTAMYVAGYVNKKVGNKDTFSLMSRKPPIGHGWVKQYKHNLRNLEKVIIEGKEYPIPKTYLNWLKGVEEYEKIKENRAETTTIYTDKQLKSKKLNYLSMKNLKSEKI